MHAKPGRAALLAGVLCLFVLVQAVRAQDAKPDIQISTRPGETGTEIKIVFPDDIQQTAATIPVFIGQGGSVSLKDVTLYGELNDCRGQPLTQGSVQFLQPETDQPLGAITLPVGRGQQRARLRVAGLGNRYGTLCGFLAAEMAGQHYSYNTLTVQRPAPAQLTIREADGKRITLSANGPALNEAVLLSETGGQTGVQDLRIAISPLRAPGNQTAVLNPPAPVTLAAGTSTVVSLTGQIPSVATYRGVMRLETTTGIQEYDLVVNRQALTATVRMDAVAPVQRMVMPVLSRLGSLLASTAGQSALLNRWTPGLVNGLATFTSLDIPITVNETSGTTADVYYPTLARLTELDAEDNTTAAQHGDPVLYDCSGKMAPVTDSQGQPALLSLKSYQSQCLRLAIPGLGQAGRYAARLELHSPSGGSSSADVSIRLKDHWIVAALVIFLGALLSYSLRHWLNVGRPTQIKTLDIIRHERLVREAIPEEKDGIRVALLDKLEDLRSEMQVNSSLDVTAALKSVVDGLNEYKLVEAVTTMDVDASVPEEHRGEARKEIDAIQALLRQADPLAQLDAAKTRADALRQRIDQWNQAALKQGIKDLTDRMAADAEELKKLKLDQNELKGYLARVEELKGLLLPAQGQVEAFEKDFEGVRRRYRQAAEGYARLAPARLRLIIAGQKRPAGFKSQEWEDLQRELLEETDKLDAQSLDPAELERRVNELWTRYLRSAADKLRMAAKDLKDQYDGAPGMEKAAKGMEETLQILDEAEAQFDKDLDKAEELCLAAGEKYMESLPPQQQGQIQGPGGQGQPGAPPAVLGRTPPVAQPGAPAPEVQKVPAPVTIKDIVADINRGDQRVLLIVSLVSVVVGISLLWVPNKTFGSLADYIAVFLWGFGLHQLNAVALPQAVRAQELPWYPAASQGQQQTPVQPGP